MKRLIVSGIVSVVVTALAAVVITACVDPEGNIVNPFYDFGELRTPHEHEWGEWTLARSATCVEEGELIRVCTEDETHVERRAIPIDPDAHNWEVTEDENYVPPTCTELGYGFQTCSRCQQFEVNGEIAPLGHEFELYELTALPNCSTPGTETAHCIRRTSGCDATDEHFTPIDPDAHEWNDEYEVTTPATCSAGGEETDSCAFNAEHTRNRETDIDPDAHDWNNVYQLTTAATCMTGGEETTYCYYNIMHTQSRETDINPDAHVYDTYLTLTVATCSEEGAEQGTCIYNRSHTPNRRAIPINPEAHDYGEWNSVGMVGIAGTCTEAGEEIRTCSRNAAHLQKKDTPVNPDAHNWNNNYKITKESTCSEEGVSTDTCGYNAEHTRTKPVAIDIMAHKYEDYQLRNSWDAPTCSRTGYNRSPCSYNPTHIEGLLVTPINPDAHVWQGYTTTTLATCSADGIRTDTCRYNPAAHQRTQVVPKDPENYHTWNYGFLEENYEGPDRPIGYKATRRELSQQPTCVDYGRERWFCGFNNMHTLEQYSYDNPPLGHLNNGNWERYRDPTCTVDGLDYIWCGRNCGNYIEGRIVSALGHLWSNWTWYTANSIPTCISGGTQERHCTRVSSSHYGSVEYQSTPSDPNAHVYPSDEADARSGNSRLTDGGPGSYFPTCSTTGLWYPYCRAYAWHNDPNDRAYSTTGIVLAVDPSQHVWNNNYQLTTPATCSAGGVETDTCSKCAGPRTRATAINANAHDFNGVGYTYSGVGEVQNGIRYKLCKLNAAHQTASEGAYATGTPGLSFSGNTVSIPPTVTGTPQYDRYVWIPDYYLNGDTYVAVNSLVQNSQGPNTYIKYIGKLDDQGLLSIGNNACKDFTSLIEIFGKITSLGDSAFANCTSLSYVDPGWGFLKKIGNYAFANCTSLLSNGLVNFDFVAEVGPYAFNNCTSLQTIYLPRLEIIGDGTSFGRPDTVFAGCTSFREISVSAATSPNYSSESGVLYNKAGTSILVVPPAIEVFSIISQPATDINFHGTFASCSKLYSITVSADHPTYASQDGILYNKDKTELIFVPKAKSGAVAIPSGVKTIKGSYNTGNAYFSSDYGAFTNCRNITSIDIPASVTEIQSLDERAVANNRGAFDGCSSLATITVANSNPNYRASRGMLFRKYSGDGNNWTLYRVPEGYTPSGDSVNNVGSFVLNGNMHWISYGAFKNCVNITNITIDTNNGRVEYIEANAFTGCTNLVKVTFTGFWQMRVFASNVDFPGDLFYLASGGDDGYGRYEVQQGTYTRSPGGSTWTKNDRESANRYITP